MSALTDRQFAAFEKELQGAGGVVDIPGLAERLTRALGTEVDTDLVLSLVAMATMARQRGWDPADAAEALVNGDGAPALTPAKRTKLQRRIEATLSSQSLEVVTLVLEALIGPGAFRGADIKTDIRPIFSETQPLTAVIVHQMNFRMVDANGEIASSLTTLDEEDVDLFIELLQEARKRGRTLKELFESKDLPITTISSGMVEDGD